MKTCSRCKVDKDESEFYKDSSRVDGIRGICKNCSKLCKAIYLENNKNKTYEYNHRPETKERKSIWDRSNAESRRFKRLDQIVKDYDNSRRRMYKKNKPFLAAAGKARRKARKLLATPLFCNDEKIKLIYREAYDLTLKTGVPHHVDHIVPLQSNTVCGLHWEGNLQILTSEDNLKKGNRVWPDMP